MRVLCILPVLGVVFAVLTFFTSYIVAVVRGDVYPWWPYISDTGTTVPESCIFGQMLTMTAFLALIGMIIRYKWIELFNTEDKKLGTFNSVAFVFGCLTCFFMTMVANFQETKIRDVHMPVSAATFTFGLLYNILQTEITRRMSPTYSTVCVWILRVVICVLEAFSFALLYGFGVTSNSKSAATFGNDSDKRLHWKPSDPGFNLHLVGTISEWCVGITTVIYFLTYCYEFGKIRLRLTPEPINEGSDDDDAPLLT